MNSEFYRALEGELSALLQGVPYETANLANAAALLYWRLPQVNWAGFYLRRGEDLVLGPFHGQPACIRIPWGKGVCGQAAAQDRPLVVADVHTFPGHIACDSASRSEMVIPLHRDGQVWGVLDLDSPILDRFQAPDQAGLLALARVLEGALSAY